MFTRQRSVSSGQKSALHGWEACTPAPSPGLLPWGTVQVGAHITVREQEQSIFRGTSSNRTGGVKALEVAALRLYPSAATQ